MDNDELLLDIARANKAKRMFELSLAELCIRSVAQNEELIATNEGQTALLDNMVLSLKTRLLIELARHAFGVPCYPARKHRVTIVKLLIHKKLRFFDFAVIGYKFSKSVNQLMWQCLAEKAGQSLLSVHDMRIRSVANESRTLAWCLPFLAMLPNIQELRLTTLSCGADELKQLIDAAPKLKALQILTGPSFKLFELESLRSKTLEEFVINPNHHVAQGGFPAKLIRMMPQLKVCCFRTDDLVDIPGDLGLCQSHSGAGYGNEGPYSLEHISHPQRLTFSQDFMVNNFPNVKHLLLTDPASSDRMDAFSVDYTKFFKQLCSLSMSHFFFCGHGVQILIANRNSITTLILDAFFPGDMISLYWILGWCKNLESLIVRGGAAAPKPMGGNLRPVEEIQLRKLHLIKFQFYDYQCLSWLLLMPMLENVKLDILMKQTLPQSFATAAMHVESGSSLRNLRSFFLALSQPHCSSNYKSQGGF